MQPEVSAEGNFLQLVLVVDLGLQVFELERDFVLPIIDFFHASYAWKYQHRKLELPSLLVGQLVGEVGARQLGDVEVILDDGSGACVRFFDHKGLDLICEDVADFFKNLLVDLSHHLAGRFLPPHRADRAQ